MISLLSYWRSMLLSIQEKSCDGRIGMLAGILSRLYLSQFRIIGPILKVMEISSPIHPEIVQTVSCKLNLNLILYAHIEI